MKKIFPRVCNVSRFLIDGCYANTELGYFINGVPIWNWADTTSYKSEDTWHNSAIAFEFYDLDICLGHAAQSEYHRKYLAVIP